MDKVRYAVVGAGWISQVAFMPSVAATGNSTMTAIVTGNAERARQLADFYDIPQVVPYAGYDEMLRAGTVDAVYVALPNSMHADFAIRAARAGVHALVEKPLAVTVAECEAMIAAAEAAGTFLMTAYRLHNEPGTVAALEAIRAGAIGRPRHFSSTFAFQSAPGNHRLEAGHWGGPLQDIGVYCVNAARQVFAAEPVEIVAMAGRAIGDPRFAEIDEAVAALLRFPRDGIASLFSSFGAAPIDTWRVLGTEGEIEMQPGFRFETAPRMILRKDGQATERSFPRLDQFGAQTAYFSDCIRRGTPPESDGAEGLADVAVLRAIEEAARTGRPQTLSLPERRARPGADTVREVPGTERRLVF